MLMMNAVMKKKKCLCSTPLTTDTINVADAKQLTEMLYYQHSVFPNIQTGICSCLCWLLLLSSWYGDFSPCQSCSRRLRHSNPPHPKESHYRKSKQIWWSNSLTPPEDKSACAGLCVCVSSVCAVFVAVCVLCGFVHWHGSLQERGSSAKCKIEKSVQVRARVHDDSVHTNRTPAAQGKTSRRFTSTVREWDPELRCVFGIAACLNMCSEKKNCPDISTPFTFYSLTDSSAALNAFTTRNISTAFGKYTLTDFYFQLTLCSYTSTYMPTVTSAACSAHT